MQKRLVAQSNQDAQWENEKKRCPGGGEKAFRPMATMGKLGRNQISANIQNFQYLPGIFRKSFKCITFAKNEVQRVFFAQTPKRPNELWKKWF